MARTLSRERGNLRTLPTSAKSIRLYKRHVPKLCFPSSPGFFSLRSPLQFRERPTVLATWCPPRWCPSVEGLVSVFHPRICLNAALLHLMPNSVEADIFFLRPLRLRCYVWCCCQPNLLSLRPDLLPFHRRVFFFSVLLICFAPTTTPK